MHVKKGESTFCQVEMSLSGYEQEIRKAFPSPVLKGSFTLHISQALKRQRNTVN